MTNRLQVVSILHVVFVAVLSGCYAAEEVKPAASEEGPTGDYTPTEPFTRESPLQKRVALGAVFKGMRNSPVSPDTGELRIFAVDVRGPESIAEVESVCQEACRIMGFDLGDDTIISSRYEFQAWENQDWALGWQSRDSIELLEDLTVYKNDMHREVAWKQGLIVNKNERIFVSPQGEMIRLRIYETPSQKHARIAWLMPYVEQIHMLGGVMRRTRELPVYRIQEGPGDVCLLPIGSRRIASKGSEAKVEWYWDDTRIIFFRENLYVYLEYVWPTKKSQDRTPLALREDRNNPMDFARQVDAELVRLLEE